MLTILIFLLILILVGILLYLFIAHIKRNDNQKQVQEVANTESQTDYAHEIFKMLPRITKRLNDDQRAEILHILSSMVGKLDKISVITQGQHDDEINHTIVKRLYQLFKAFDSDLHANGSQLIEALRILDKELDRLKEAFYNHDFEKELEFIRRQYGHNVGNN
jgi:hypothetical protein